MIFNIYGAVRKWVEFESYYECSRLDHPCLLTSCRSVSIPLPREETLSRHSILGPNGLHGQWQPPRSDIGVWCLWKFFFGFKVEKMLTFLLIAGPISKHFRLDSYWNPQVSLLVNFLKFFLVVLYLKLDWI